MVLARARRTAGTDPRDVDLVDLIEARGSVPRQHARQARREASANRERAPTLTSLRVEVEQVVHVVERVAHRHDVRAGAKCVCRRRGVAAGWSREHDDVVTTWRCAVRGHRDAGRTEHPGDPRADRAATDDDGMHGGSS
jgi:hypothetical protein